jgi:hypothetical protein
MRPFLACAALATFALGCAGPRPLPERAAVFAHPEPDPGCRVLVADSMRLAGVEQVTVRVALAKQRAAVVDLLAPELTPAAAAEVRRAFADCAWRPGAGGATTGTIVFNLPR